MSVFSKRNVVFFIVLFSLILVPPPRPAAEAGEKGRPTLNEVIEDDKGAWDESLKKGQDDYHRLSIPFIRELTGLLGGQWWVVGFDEEEPFWFRGAIYREEIAFDREEAVRAAELVKNKLTGMMGWSGRFFAPPVIGEDPWTFIVQYGQQHQGKEIDGAFLRFRVFKEYTPTDRKREQWNMEVVDVSAVPPERDFTTSVSSEEAIKNLRDLQLLTGDPKAPPDLLFCFENEMRSPFHLCWRVEDRRKTYDVDAESGRLIRTIDKTWLLR